MEAMQEAAKHVQSGSVTEVDKRQILGLPAFADPTTGLHVQNTGKLGSPLGAEMIVCDEVADATIIMVKRNFLFL